MRETSALIGIMAVALALLASDPAAPVAAQGRASETLPAKAQEQVLYSFIKAKGFDHMPMGDLVRDAAGNLYGTTFSGGNGRAGNVFELSPQSGGGWAYTVLHSFKFGSGDGNYPGGSLIFDWAGNLYGATSAGGLYNRGTVFQLSPQSGGEWIETVLFSFNGTDGNSASSLVLDAAGNLYGTTGGGSSLQGAVFELSPQEGGNWSEAVLYNFQGGQDAQGPFSSLVFDAADNLYGTSAYGGRFSDGTVFQLSPNGHGGWSEKVLHSFNPNGTDGVSPFGGVIFDANGNLYGTTFFGGNGGSGCSDQGCGTVFELIPKLGGGWTEKVLHAFSNMPDGAMPTAGLTLDAVGNLYGTTDAGGSQVCTNGTGCGTVFSLSNSGGAWHEQVLHSFRGSSNDGHQPVAGVILDGSGNLFGTTEIGGAYGGGTVFEVTP